MQWYGIDFLNFAQHFSLNDNNKDGENKAEFGAREHTELLNDNFDSMEDLIEKFKSGEMKKELVVEDGKVSIRYYNKLKSTL